MFFNSKLLKPNICRFFLLWINIKQNANNISYTPIPTFESIEDKFMMEPPCFLSIIPLTTAWLTTITDFRLTLNWLQCQRQSSLLDPTWFYSKNEFSTRTCLKRFTTLPDYFEFFWRFQHTFPASSKFVELYWMLFQACLDFRRILLNTFKTPSRTSKLFSKLT